VAAERGNQQRGRPASGSRAQWCYALVMSALLHASVGIGVALLGRINAGRTTLPSPMFRSGRSADPMPRVFLIAVPPIPEPAPADRAEPDRGKPLADAEVRPTSLGARAVEASPKASLAGLSQPALEQVAAWLKQRLRALPVQSEKGGRAVQALRSAPGVSAVPDVLPEEPLALPEIALHPPRPAAHLAGVPADGGQRAPSVTAQPHSPIGAKPAETGVAQAAEPREEVSPEYPPASIRRGEQGLVLLGVQVRASGRPAGAWILKSSGYDRLDQAALEAVRRARFRPARRNGCPVTSWVTVPVRFVLH